MCRIWRKILRNTLIGACLAMLQTRGAGVLKKAADSNKSLRDWGAVFSHGRTQTTLLFAASF